MGCPWPGSRPPRAAARAAVESRRAPRRIGVSSAGRGSHRGAVPTRPGWALRARPARSARSPYQPVGTRSGARGRGSAGIGCHSVSTCLENIFLYALSEARMNCRLFRAPRSCRFATLDVSWVAMSGMMYGSSSAKSVAGWSK